MFGLSSVEKGQTKPTEAESLQKELLDTNKCYILDCGLELFVWKGKNTSIDQRKRASETAEVNFFSCTKRIVFGLMSFAKRHSCFCVRSFSVHLNVQNQT